MTRDKLGRATERIIKQALKLRRDESFLLVTDREKLEMAEALAAWAKKVGAETTTYLMTKTLRPIVELTRLLREMAKTATSIAHLLEARIEEKPFQSFLVKTGLNSSRHHYEALVEKVTIKAKGKVIIQN
jgi:leucyl aminopeptidase (aminopeptidase T)